MRITSKGQVTIPAEIREELGFLPGTEVAFAITGKTLCLRKSKARSRAIDTLISRLRGKGTVKMTTDQIMALTR